MLIICPTPIGNLEDLTVRQRQALNQANIIACEDTRTTGKLLELLGIERQGTQLISYHDHNARERTTELILAMQEGKRVVLVSDAGTPTISDPGYRLVQQAGEANIKITALPGPIAAITALSASGLPTDRFYFEGFLPTKQLARTTKLSLLKQLQVTTIFYESPHRVCRMLEDVEATFGPTHPVCVARELTKMHEEYLRGTVASVLTVLKSRPKLRGEFVVMLAPAEDTIQFLEGAALDEKINAMLDEGLRTKNIRDILAPRVELSSSQLYEHIERVRAQRKHGA